MKLVWTPEAADDLDQVLSYIAGRNPAAASVVAERIDRALGNIRHFPNAARFDEETGAREYVLRGLPLLIIYTVTSDAVEIVAVFHTSRDPQGKSGL